ncbi:MAG: phage integrase N-terminal SAM-like domain-containing protein [Gemmatimonadales bacterium]
MASAAIWFGACYAGPSDCSCIASMGAMPKPKLLQSLRANLHLRHFSPRTEEAYSAWVRRYVRFHRLRHPVDMGEGRARGRRCGSRWC